MIVRILGAGAGLWTLVCVCYIDKLLFKRVHCIKFAKVLILAEKEGIKRKYVIIFYVRYNV